MLRWCRFLENWVKNRTRRWWLWWRSVKYTFTQFHWLVLCLSILFVFCAHLDHSRNQERNAIFDKQHSLEARKPFRKALDYSHAETERVSDRSQNKGDWLAETNRETDNIWSCRRRSGWTATDAILITLPKTRRRRSHVCAATQDL
jgi:hypothetical protein